MEAQVCFFLHIFNVKLVASLEPADAAAQRLFKEQTAVVITYSYRDLAIECDLKCGYVMDHWDFSGFSFHKAFWSCLPAGILSFQRILTS